MYVLCLPGTAYYDVPGLLFWMIVLHFALDFPLQGDTVAKEKSRHSRSELQKHVPWYYWMTAHAFCQAGGVFLIARSLWLAGAELVVHWLTDFLKCDNRISVHVDQAVHITCKVLWAFMVAYALPPS